MKYNIILFACSVFLYCAGYYTLIHRIAPFALDFYLAVWWSYIMFLDSLVSFGKKGFSVFNKSFLFIVLVSCAYWCFYEIINIRIQNWYYVDLPAHIPHRYIGYLLAYGTVIPAICLTTEALHMFIGRIVIKPFSARRYPLYSISIGVILFILTISFPLYCFPLTWIFLPLIIDGYNYTRKGGSFMRELEHGDAGRLTAAVFSGVICGILWETWNYTSISKWKYSVPFFDSMKVFEMPVPGYLGFLMFAVGTVSFADFLKTNVKKTAHIYLAGALSLAFSLFSFFLIDHYTVTSFILLK